MVEAQGHSYNIMDALDKRPITSSIPSPREEVLELVDELVSLHIPIVDICITSRPEHDMQAAGRPQTLNCMPCPFMMKPNRRIFPAMFPPLFAQIERCGDGIRFFRECFDNQSLGL
jgi:hypothetical protein